MESPIGIFDSGIGGTSIWREIITLLPSENTIYLADCKYAPYGEREPHEILELSIKNTELLLKMGSKLVVVACNTATTNAIAQLRMEYDIPFIGIEPAIKPAALHSISKTVGVLATKGTLSSSLFYETSKNHASDITVIEQEGTGLVKLIEEGKTNTPETKEVLQKFLDPMIEADIDHLVLGCTHYPYLIPQLKEVLPTHVKIIDCGAAVARQTAHILRKNNLLNKGTNQGRHLLFANANLEILKDVVKDVRAEKVIEYLDF